VASVVPIPKKQAKRTPRPKLVHQFLVVLSGTDPLVWRHIQVPEKYSFWDLHVAIQDAMGWLDYHLHEFRLLDATEQAAVSTAMPSCYRSSLIPITRSTNRPSVGRRTVRPGGVQSSSGEVR
jgi:hypothetical protein